MQGSSRQDNDGIVWGTTALRLGTDGMDLRHPTEPAALADLFNARFLDERTLQRRDGHYGQGLQDGSAFPAGPIAPGAWLYGHGQLMASGDDATYPVHLRGGLTFRLGDADVAWTGDRLLIPQSNNNVSVGSSTFWQRVRDINNGDSATMQYHKGVPAFFPLQTDVPAPSPVTGDWVDACLTSRYRTYCYIGGNLVTAVTLDRVTGQVLDITDITGTSTSPSEPSVVNNNDVPTIIFRDGVDTSLRIRFWTGTGWSVEQDFGTLVSAYDVAQVSGGIYVAWVANQVMTIGAFYGTTTGAAPFPFATALSSSGVPLGATWGISIAVAPQAYSAGSGAAWAVAYSTMGSPLSNVTVDEYQASGANTGFTFSQAIGGAGVRGISLTCRGLLEPDVREWEWVLHTSDTNGLTTIFSFSEAYGATFATARRYNSVMLSRSFTVGDEVFCWLGSSNAETAYLLAGATHPVVAGYADREIAVEPKVPGSNFVYWPARPLPDPADASGETWTWTRKFNTGVSSKTGDVLSGDMDFTPHPCTTIYGKSAYISGSAVKNFDGVYLNDAGYQDFPVVGSSIQGGTGGLTLLGQYQYRIKAVRYNTQGERFESAAVTYVAPQLTGSNGTITLTINTLPSISGPASSPDTNDVVLEIYRTQSTLSTFYLEGTVANSLTAGTVTFLSTMSDALLLSQIADPTATGVGNVSEIESFGPIGCSILTTVGDRLWGAGGQVPPGVVQFSKLKDVGFGAGFDDLAGYLQVDNEDQRITSLAGQNGALVAFEVGKAYVYGNNGPDNDGVGSFGVPSVVLAGGALNHFGTELCQLGILYWGIEGPMLLDQSFTVMNISAPMRALTSTLSPAGVRVDTSRMEAVWYCGAQAVLWNYMGGTSRWGRWTTPDVVSVSDSQLMTFGGRLLTENPAAPGDDGVPFGFGFKTGDIRPEALREGYDMVRRVGFAGEYEGQHLLRMRVFFDGSALWSEESVWNPQDTTWLTTCAAFATLTPTGVDAKTNADRSGQYGMNKRLRRETCRYIAIEVTDISSLYNTLVPFELAFEMGTKPGLTRTPVNTFTGQDR